MGGTYMAETVTAPSRDLQAAHAALLARFRDQGQYATEVEAAACGEYDISPWPDPFTKGWRQVWPKPVKDFAVEWMRGWIAQHPPQGTDPDDKWGPWMVFPLENPGSWHFFGWVNT